MTAAMEPRASNPGKAITLHQVSLFAHLSEAEMACTREGHEVCFAAGETIARQSDENVFFYVLLQGLVNVTQQVGGQDIVLTTYEPGHFFGELPMLLDEPFIATGKAIEDCVLMQWDREPFWRMLMSCPSLARTILHTMAQRVKMLQNVSQQREKLAALGTLAAGMAHEMNNPASACVRAGEQIQQMLDELPGHCTRLAKHKLPCEVRESLNALAKQAQARLLTCVPTDTLTQSDREDTVADWLDGHGVTEAWNFAPTLVEAGIDPVQLEAVAAQTGAEALLDVFPWLHATLTLARLAQESQTAARRISDLIETMKAYSFLDQAPQQEIVVHEQLNNVLAVLQFQISEKQAHIVREYEPDLPPIPAHGSELNQVWTNLIDNALNAICDGGEIRLRTWCEMGHVVVEIADNGSGIPPENLSRIWEPFFTTRDVGEGVGLGLDACYRIITTLHKGDIHVSSKPGDTRFQVFLPLTAPAS